LMVVGPARSASNDQSPCRQLTVAVLPVVQVHISASGWGQLACTTLH